MPLQEEIDLRAAQIFTDSYAMSIGEVMSLYEKHELDIHPEFQRFFRWTTEQKSRLVESILLGIPLPSVFVAQRADGVWEVIDGLQRLGTVFEFAGILRDPQGDLVAPLRMTPTKYLPSLGGKGWDVTPAGESLTPSQRLLFKRAKVDIKILKRQSDEISKYELFQRLNTGGTPLTDQEVRNCILVMENLEFFRWLRGLSEYEPFRNCLVLSDNAKEQQYDIELVVRFLTLRTISTKSLSGLGDLGLFLTDRIVELADSKDYDRSAEERAFKDTFSLLHAALSEDSFRRYDIKKKGFMGGFLVSGFEAVALGVGFHHGKSLPSEKIRRVAEKLWADAEFRKGAKSGMRAAERMRISIPFGRKAFAPK